jgi:Ca2+/H+ antiporter, TMEM165/GDT1 family
VVIGGAGALARRAVERIPRSALQLLVGTLLSAFGTFWAVEGLGITWPGADLAIVALAAWYILAAAAYSGRLRRHTQHATPQGKLISQQAR